MRDRMRTERVVEAVRLDGGERSRREEGLDLRGGRGGTIVAPCKSPRPLQVVSGTAGVSSK